MIHKLYTLGYTGLLPADLLQLTQHLDAVLADIRFSPYSRHPQWHKANLLDLLGDRYRHIPELGNVNYKGDLGAGIILKDVEQGTIEVARLIQQQSVILLCACKDWHACHRQTAADEMQQRYNVEVIHLSLPEVGKLLRPPEPAEPIFKPVQRSLF
jgi:uncharacterized protein (DUF488 family)